MNNLPPAERDIAMVFQNYALYPHKTVAANMAFALRMRRMDKAEVARRVERAADVLGLTPYLDRYPRALSGGQRQRVAMGRAIVRDPRVFLFDEPLSNLDAKLRVQMRAEIRELHQRLSTTTVYVTHDQIEAMTMADKIVVLRDGHVAQIGTPLDLYDRPANAFVAEFIGSPSMNMLDAVLRTQEGAIWAEVGPARFRIEGAPGVEDGRRVRLGVRPEHLRPTDEGLPAEVAVVEQTGSETHVVLRANGSELTAIVRDRRDFRPGQGVHLDTGPGARSICSTRKAGNDWHEGDVRVLKGIDNRLNAEVLFALRAMGHGDALVIADTNFPSDQVARRTVLGKLLRMDNLTAAEAVEAVLSVLPLDTFVDDFAGRMEVVGAKDDLPPVQEEVQAAIDAAEGRPRPMIGIERFDFYDRARASYAVIQTGERRFYGCFILRKGVIPPEE